MELIFWLDTYLKEYWKMPKYMVYLQILLVIFAASSLASYANDEDYYFNTEMVGIADVPKNHRHLLLKKILQHMREDDQLDLADKRSQKRLHPQVLYSVYLLKKNYYYFYWISTLS